MRKMFLKMPLLIFFLLACKPMNKPVSKDYAVQNNQALTYCESNNFNTDFYILIDLSIHSGSNRLFVYNFKTKKNDFEKLVTHGTCDVFSTNEKMWEKAKFSNKIDSHCSSKGKFKIGKREYSSWGIKVKYWLHG